MQNISYLEITSKLPKLGSKKLYFGVDITAYDGIRLLILQRLFLIDNLRKLYLKDRDIGLLIKINENLTVISILINSFDFIFDKLIVAKFNKLLSEILSLLSQIKSSENQQDIKFKELLTQIESYFDKKFESLCFEFEIFLYDTHSFYCVLDDLMPSCAAYAIRKKIVNLRQSIRDSIKSDLFQELLTLTRIFLELFNMGKFELKLTKIVNLKSKYQNANQRDIKVTLKKELEKKVKKFDKKLSKMSKKLKPHYKKEI